LAEVASATKAVLLPDLNVATASEVLSAPLIGALLSAGTDTGTDAPLATLTADNHLGGANLVTGVLGLNAEVPVVSPLLGLSANVVLGGQTDSLLGLQVGSQVGTSAPVLSGEVSLGSPNRPPVEVQVNPSPVGGGDLGLLLGTGAVNTAPVLQAAANLVGNAPAVATPVLTDAGTDVHVSVGVSPSPEPSTEAPVGSPSIGLTSNPTLGGTEHPSLDQFTLAVAASPAPQEVPLVSPAPAGTGVPVSAVRVSPDPSLALPAPGVPPATSRPAADAGTSPGEVILPVQVSADSTAVARAADQVPPADLRQGVPPLADSVVQGVTTAPHVPTDPRPVGTQVLNALPVTAKEERTEGADTGLTAFLVLSNALLSGNSGFSGTEMPEALPVTAPVLLPQTPPPLKREVVRAESGAAEEADEFPPEGSGLLTDFQPEVPAVVDGFFEVVLDQADHLGSWLGRFPLTPWLAGLLVAGGAYQAARRRRPSAGLSLAAGEEDEADTDWLTGLSDHSGVPI